MRMSDRPTVEETISMNASPATVWALVTDLNAVGHWSPEYLSLLQRPKRVTQ